MPIESKHPEYKVHESAWKDCRTFYEGETAVKDAGELYLPKPEGLKTKEYRGYKQRAFFLGAVESTLIGLVGAVDRKPPAYKVPNVIEDRVYDIDNDGTSLRVFSKSVLSELLLMGRVGLLVDRDTGGIFPPYIVKYNAEDIVNWQEDKGIPTLIVLKETYYEAKVDDIYELEMKTRFRELFLEDGAYRVRLWLPVETKGSAKQSWVAQEVLTPTRTGSVMDEIPFVFCGPLGLNSTVEKSPCLNLVRKNIEHYRVSADYAAALYFVGNPFVVAPGLDAVEAGKITLGSSKVIGIPEGADVKIVECQGHGVDPNRQKANECKEEMVILGARLLESQKRAAETAEAMRIRESSRSSTLMNCVISASAAIEKALKFVTTWENTSDAEVEFLLNQDFVDIEIQPELIRAMSEQVDKGYMSWETMFFNLAVGELVPEGRTADDEKDLIKQGSPVPRPALTNPFGNQPPQDQNNPPQDQNKPPQKGK